MRAPGWIGVGGSCLEARAWALSAKRGLISGTLEAKFPTITGPDGTVYPLYED